MFWLIGVLRPGIGVKCASMLTTVWLIDASCRSETAGPEDLSPSHTAAVEERGWLVRYIMCILGFFVTFQPSFPGLCHPLNYLF